LSTIVKCPACRQNIILMENAGEQLLTCPDCGVRFPPPERSLQEDPNWPWSLAGPFSVPVIMAGGFGLSMAVFTTGPHRLFAATACAALLVCGLLLLRIDHRRRHQTGEIGVKMLALEAIALLATLAALLFLFANWTLGPF
jgi:hypothetical protein